MFHELHTRYGVMGKGWLIILSPDPFTLAKNVMATLWGSGLGISSEQDSWVKAFQKVRMQYPQAKEGNCILWTATPRRARYTTTPRKHTGHPSHETLSPSPSPSPRAFRNLRPAPEGNYRSFGARSCWGIASGQRRGLCEGLVDEYATDDNGEPHDGEDGIRCQHSSLACREGEDGRGRGRVLSHLVTEPL